MFESNPTMTLPDHVATQYGVYTLACHSLLARLTQLRAVASHQNLEAYIQRFDEALRAFFRGVPFPALTSVKTAASYFNNRLRVERDEIKVENEAAAAVFDQIINTVDRAAPTWSYAENVAVLHRIGCDIARCFYKQSPWNKTRELQSEEAVLEFQAIQPEDKKGSRGWGASGVGRAALMGCQPTENKIVVRFSVDHRFDDYILYPFSFLHEYTAHIYGVDLENTIFNDGWMVYAAHVFLTKCYWSTRKGANCFWNPQGKPCSKDHLDQKQIDICADRFPHDLKELCHSYSGYLVAQNFFAWSTSWSDSLFWEFTWELAAFSPEPGEHNWLVTDFIKSLSAELSRDHAILRRKLEHFRDFRSLLRVMHI